MGISLPDVLQTEKVTVFISRPGFELGGRLDFGSSSLLLFRSDFRPAAINGVRWEIWCIDLNGDNNYRQFSFITRKNAFEKSIAFLLFSNGSCLDNIAIGEIQSASINVYCPEKNIIKVSEPIPQSTFYLGSGVFLYRKGDERFRSYLVLIDAKREIKAEVNLAELGYSHVIPQLSFYIYDPIRNTAHVALEVRSLGTIKSAIVSYSFATQEKRIRVFPVFWPYNPCFFCVDQGVFFNNQGKIWIYDLRTNNLLASDYNMPVEVKMSLYNTSFFYSGFCSKPISIQLPQRKFFIDLGFIDGAPYIAFPARAHSRWYFDYQLSFFLPKRRNGRFIECKTIEPVEETIEHIPYTKCEFVAVSDEALRP